MKKEKRYWYTHAESDSVWIGPDGEAPGVDNHVIQHREATAGEVDDEANIKKFNQELQDNWHKRMIRLATKK